jgi:hypothetical protein
VQKSKRNLLRLMFKRGRDRGHRDLRKIKSVHKKRSIILSIMTDTHLVMIPEINTIPAMIPEIIENGVAILNIHGICDPNTTTITMDHQEEDHHPGDL